MTPTEPELAMTGRYPIGQAAQLLGIHRNTLRRYTENRLIRAHVKSSGRLYYLGCDLRRLWRML
jgi:excisionase family DNA binding protein